MKRGSTVSEVRLKKEGELNPVIIEFLNGNVPEQKLSSLEVKLKPYKNLSENAVEITTPDKRKYVNDPINKSLFNNTYIAIRNKKTNKIRVIEAGITPVINSVYLNKKEMKSDNKDVKQQIATLQKLFGTKKAVRRLEQREALDIDKSHIEVQIQEILASTSDANISAMQESFNKSSNEIEKDCLIDLIPPCHREEIDITKVYRVEDCLSEEEISSLEDGVEKIIQQGKNHKNKSNFMQEYLPHALAEESNLKVRLSCLLYADALVNYLRAPARNLSKISQTLCPYSKLIGDKIIREFCIKTGNSMNRPLAMKDKAVCYIIVLILIACNYRIDLEALSRIVSCGYKKLKQLGRIIGILPVGKLSNIHSLELPLPPPVKMLKPSKSNNKRSSERYVEILNI